MAIENVSHHDCLLELSEEDWRAVHGDLLPLPNKNIKYKKNPDLFGLKSNMLKMPCLKKCKIQKNPDLYWSSPTC